MKPLGSTELRETRFFHLLIVKDIVSNFSCWDRQTGVAIMPIAPEPKLASTADVTEVGCGGFRAETCVRH